jgi:hypothetical protein
MEIIYVEMPISIEQKKEYNRRGYRVVDAAFAPKGYEPPFDAELAVQTIAESVSEPEVGPKRTRRRRAESEE